MSRPTLVPEAIARYVTETMVHETPLQKELRAETAVLREGQMQIGADQGRLFSLLVRAINAPASDRDRQLHRLQRRWRSRRPFPPSGKLVCCDMSEEWTAGRA